MYTIPSEDDANRGTTLTVTFTILITIATAVVLLRLYVRLLTKNLGLDDLFIMLSLLCSIACTILGLFMLHLGIGRHMQYLSRSPELLARLSQALKIETIAEVIIICSLILTKTSICLFLLRIFGKNNKVWRWGLYSIMAFSTATNLASIAVIYPSCRPVQKLWNLEVPGICWGPRTYIAIAEYNGAISILSDWALASLPIVFMWNIQMSIKIKVGIAALMGAGFFTGVCAIIRTAFVKDQQGVSPDISWDMVDLVIWALLEATVGIITACVPTLKPLFNRPLCYPWSGKSWMRTLSGAKPPCEDTDRLHNHALSLHDLSTPQVSREDLPVIIDDVKDPPFGKAWLLYPTALLHDWPDKQAREILNNRLAMNKQSILLINEDAQKITCLRIPPS